VAQREFIFTFMQNGLYNLPENNPETQRELNPNVKKQSAKETG
jgi:hypothetical protein